MKNNDLQEIKPIYIHEANYSPNDEISLVNLVAVLFRRKLLIATICIIFTSSGLAYALLTPRIYTYSAALEVGTQIIDGSIKTFETPDALLAKIQYSYTHQALSEQRQSHPDDKQKYKIKSSVPSDSKIVLLQLNGNEDQTDTINKLLQSISDKAIKDHSKVYNSIKKDLEARLNQATSELETLKSSDGNKTEVSNTQNIIDSLNTQLANLRKTTQVSQPHRSLEPTGISRKTIVIVSVFTGIIIGVFAAFFAEFWLKVREVIDE